jgi:hypothetical protein
VLRATRKQRRDRARQERRAREAAERRAADARRRIRLIGSVAIGLLGAATVAALAARGGWPPSRDAVARAVPPRLAPVSSLGALKPPGAAGAVGPEGVPIPGTPLLATTTPRGGAPVDGIECSRSEQTLFHIHVHLTIFVDGAARQVPYGIGIPGAAAQSTPLGTFVGSGDCFYWLHTHAADGIIHIESPIERVYTLGNFFDVWGQPLSSSRVGPAAGPVTALYGGERYEGDPRAIPLTAHAQIQLEVGRPLVAPKAIRLPAGL